MLSSHYQGTPYDPYASYGDKSMKGAYRSIGINRNDFMALIQMRPDVPEDNRALSGSPTPPTRFNTMVPFYANVDHHPGVPGLHHRRGLHRQLLLGQPDDRRHGGCLLMPRASSMWSGMSWASFPPAGPS